MLVFQAPYSILQHGVVLAVGKFSKYENRTILRILYNLPQWEQQGLVSSYLLGSSTRFLAFALRQLQHKIICNFKCFLMWFHGLIICILNPFWHLIIQNNWDLPARCQQNSIDATKCWQCHEYRDNKGKVAIHFCCKWLEIKYMKSSYLVETKLDSNYETGVRVNLYVITTATASDPSTSGTDKVV